MSAERLYSANIYRLDDSANRVRLWCFRHVQSPV